MRQNFLMRFTAGLPASRLLLLFACQVVLCLAETVLSCVCIGRLFAPVHHCPSELGTISAVTVVALRQYPERVLTQTQLILHQLTFTSTFQNTSFVSTTNGPEHGE